MSGSGGSSGDGSGGSSGDGSGGASGNGSGGSSGDGSNKGSGMDGSSGSSGYGSSRRSSTSSTSGEEGADNISGTRKGIHPQPKHERREPRRPGSGMGYEMPDNDSAGRALQNYLRCEEEVDDKGYKSRQATSNLDNLNYLKTNTQVKLQKDLKDCEAEILKFNTYSVTTVKQLGALVHLYEQFPAWDVKVFNAGRKEEKEKIFATTMPSGMQITDEPEGVKKQRRERVKKQRRENDARIAEAKARRIEAQVAEALEADVTAKKRKLLFGGPRTSWDDKHGDDVTPKKRKEGNG